MRCEVFFEISAFNYIKAPKNYVFRGFLIFYHLTPHTSNFILALSAGGIAGGDGHGGNVFGNYTIGRYNAATTDSDAR